MAQITTYGNPEKSEAQKIADAERLREFGPKKKHVPVVPELTPEEVAERQAKMDRVAELMLEKEKHIGTFYRGLKMAVAPLWKDQENALEMGKICAELGINNPYVVTVMGIGEGAGIPQDKLHLFDLVCDKLKRKFRGTGSIIRENFEAP
jgi:hypothetical protein